MYFIKYFCLLAIAATGNGIDSSGDISVDEVCIYEEVLTFYNIISKFSCFYCKEHTISIVQAFLMKT